MTLPKIDIDRFLNLSNIPTFIQPWLDRFFEDVKVELLLLGEKPLHIDEVSVKWRVAKANFNPDKTQAFLERCYKRGIIAKRMEKKPFLVTILIADVKNITITLYSACFYQDLVE